MNFTEEMLAEDEKRWAARDVVTELGYCGNYMRDRKDMMNLDIRFYAYLMRKAHEILKRQEPVKPNEYDPVIYGTKYTCGKCRHKIFRNVNYCSNCGQAVEWDG